MTPNRTEIIVETKPLVKGWSDEDHEEKRLDWNPDFDMPYSKANLRKAIAVAKKKLKTGKVFEAHVCAWDNLDEDPVFQEFLRYDGTKFKMW